MLRNIQILMFICACAGLKVPVENESLESLSDQKGIMDPIIRQILENLRPKLENISITHFDIKTGEQEYGSFNVTVDDVIINNLSAFDIVNLSTNLFTIRNLTLAFDSIIVTGKYNLDGMLVFPLGSNDIHLLGVGSMWLEFKNFVVTTEMAITSLNGSMFVKSLDFSFHFDQMHTNFENLMNGGKLGDTFNSLINEISSTIVGYYRESAIEKLKPVIIKMMDHIFCCYFNQCDCTTFGDLKQ